MYSVFARQTNLCHHHGYLYEFCKCYLQIGAYKKAEAVATVVAAVDQARVREPWELEHDEEGYAEQTALEYGYKERTMTGHIVEVPAERHVVTKPVHVPSETKVSTTEKMGMHISTQVRLGLHCTLSLAVFFFFLNETFYFAVW